jgi:hypothetical protein
MPRVKGRPCADIPVARTIAPCSGGPEGGRQQKGPVALLGARYTTVHDACTLSRCLGIETAEQLWPAYAVREKDSYAILE